MKYFTIEEFIKSSTADKYGIDNTPEQWQINNIIEFVNNLLDPLREAWAEHCRHYNLGSPAIKVTSGVRSKALNKKLGSSNTSSHYYGSAVDMVPANGKLKEFKDFCIFWLKDKSFDQLISENENEKGVPKWMHLGYKRYDGVKRHQFMYMVNNKYYNI
jgi:putative chitinase